jgi:hypothetical protein
MVPVGIMRMLSVEVRKATTGATELEPYHPSRRVEPMFVLLHRCSDCRIALAN